MADVPLRLGYNVSIRPGRIDAEVVHPVTKAMDGFALSKGLVTSITAVVAPWRFASPPPESFNASVGPDTEATAWVPSDVLPED